MHIICNGQIVRENGIEPGTVAFEGGRLVTPPARPGPGDTVIDAGGQYVAPGLIDLHTHGGGGFDFLDGTADAFLGAARLHARYGTTTLIPTATSGSEEETLHMLRVYEGVRSASGAMSGGAEMPGVHLEGPYFSPDQCGAQDKAFLRIPRPEEYLRILAASPHILRWSAAPELPGTGDFAAALRARGVLPAIGHSDADYDTVKGAQAQGFTHLTHLYSCMSTVSRRQGWRYAGVVESAYLLTELTVEIIADGIHLPPPLLELVFRFIGPDRTALVTDSMRGAGMPDGESILGSRTHGRPVLIEDGVAKLPDRSAFAGSTATMDRLVRNMYRLAHAPLDAALRMATATPARIMGLSDRGRLLPGLRADLILLDRELRVTRTVVGGVTVYDG